MDFEVHPPGTAARLQAIDAGGCAPPVLSASMLTPTDLELARRCEVAERRIADALRLLDDYRERGSPMPTYAQLMRALQG